jgi:hypothetical protein
MMNTSCIHTFDAMGCKAAENFCLKKLQEPYLRSGSSPGGRWGWVWLIYYPGRNPYDMSKTCDVVSNHLACIPLAQCASFPLILSAL